MDSWGTSWGASWGDSWGINTPPPPSGNTSLSGLIINVGRMMNRGVISSLLLLIINFI